MSTHPVVGIGQIWKRKLGHTYKITDEKIVSGMRHVRLTPEVKGKGRSSWKWSEAVPFEMEYMGTKQ